MMKVISRIILLICVVFPISMSAVQLKVYNPTDTERENAPVVVKLNSLKKIKTKDRQKLAVFVNGEQISSQLDDLNGDGIADELVFLLDFQAKQTRTVEVKAVTKKEKKNFPAEVYTDLIMKGKDGKFEYVNEASSTKNDMYNALHHHGIAFESSLIAYRIYFDNKSTIDVYGKKKMQLELAKTGWYPTDEQLAEGYGDDILKVSGSAGVGAVKGWNGKKATHIDKFDKRTQRIVSKGNLRTISESIVEGWEYEGKKINMTVRYIQYARNRDAMAEIVASDNIENLATGVQKIASGSLFDDKSGLVGSWGTDFPVNDTIKYAKQTCGLGVYVPAPTTKHTTDNSNNLVLMPYAKGTVLRFYLTAVSEKEEFCTIKNAEEFFEYLKNWKKSCQDIIVL